MAVKKPTKSGMVLPECKAWFWGLHHVGFGGRIFITTLWIVRIKLVDTYKVLGSVSGTV